MRINRTIEALKRNGFDARFIDSETALFKTLDTLVPDGSTVSSGGSVTLDQLKVLDYIRDRDLNFLDRYKPGLSREEIRELFIKTFAADTYFASANAVTEHGEIYMVDGNGNRIAATIFGPEQVILITSEDKIVASLADAVARVKRVAAPCNAVRLHKDTFCAEHGRCMNPVSDPQNLMALGAGACKTTICSDYVILSHQTPSNTGRIKVLIIPSGYGY